MGMVSVRNAKAEETRERILQVTAMEMIRVGYRALGLSEILDHLQMSKGALYHHFKNKLELGYAVLDEVYASRFASLWVSPLEQEDPLQAIIDLLRKVSAGTAMDVNCGCPINNLAAEMSPIDEGFRERVERVYKRWRNRLTEAFLRAQAKGYMRGDVDAEETAMFIIASVQGAMVLAKNAQNCEVFAQTLKPLIHYLTSLQPDATVHA